MQTLVSRCQQYKSSRGNKGVRVFTGLFFILACFPVLAAELPSVAKQHENHTHHLEMLKEASGYSRLEKDYPAPDVTLVDLNGVPVPLRQLLGTEEPILLQFIFTSCTTICPVLSATFGAAQEQINALGRPYRMVSISIDPEEDTPDRLRDYSKRFNSGKQWVFLTGAPDKILAVEKAFDSYASNNKMYHQPYTFIRAHAGAPWVRLDGFLSTTDLVAEYRKTLAEYDTLKK